MLRARSRDHALRLGDNVAADDDDDDEDGDAGKMTTRSVAPEVRPPDRRPWPVCDAGPPADRPTRRPMNSDALSRRDGEITRPLHHGADTAIPGRLFIGFGPA